MKRLFVTVCVFVDATVRRAGPTPMPGDGDDTTAIATGDMDGDGDLDLLVGGYSMWDPVAPELTAEQVARADALEAEIEALGAKRQAMTSEALDGAEDVQVAYQALREDPAYKRIGEALAAATEELETLRPKAKREAAVWLYERLGEPTSTPVDAGATKQR